MIGNVDYSTILIIALISVSFSVYQTHAQSRTCSLLSRPHPNGFCGEKLALVHRNLCFLIRQSNPKLYPLVKRSVSSAAEDKFHKSRSDLVNLEAENNGLADYQDHKEADSSPLPSNSILVPALMSSYLTDYPSESETGSTLIDMLQKRRGSRTKRSLVCECCYGPCTVRIIAHYC
uniref:Insulin-like domain-containing protein n=1 Tax=Arion vulgaris TaxID=1028688 RepID=A0A0B6Z7D4_9EUPU